MVLFGGCLPPMSPRSPLSGRCLAAVSVMAPHPGMPCRIDGHRLWWMLCRHDLFSSRCFAAVVALASLADALPSRLIANWKLAPSTLRFHYTTGWHCVVFLYQAQLVRVLWWRFPLVFFLLSVCACGVSLVILGLLTSSLYHFSNLFLMKYM
jgi:hypothetical protein